MNEYLWKIIPLFYAGRI